MSVLRLKTRPGGSGGLSALLKSDRFRLGRETGRLTHNLETFGGTTDEGAAVWIGANLPPHGSLSITLGAARGTLGPFSFGFLDNTHERGTAAFAASLPARPRRGPIALVCGRRDDLPEIAPLVLSRDLGVSWIISAGEGSVDEICAFLAADASTRAVLLAASGARPGSIGLLGGKPVAVLAGDPLLRAAARRGGGADAADLEAWFAYAALLEAGVPAPSRPVAVVVGGGARLVEQVARAARFELPITVVSEDDPDEAREAIAARAAESDLVIVAGSDFSGLAQANFAGPHVTVDLGHLDRLRAILAAITVGRAPAQPAAPRPRFDDPQVKLVLDAAGSELSDHDTKRLLKACGVRVSRQAPASSPTAAARIAAQVGYPVDVAAGVFPGALAGALAGAHSGALPPVRHAPAAAELRRAASLLLNDAPFVLVREAFPDEPRAHFAVRHEPDLGAYALVRGTSKAAKEGDAQASKEGDAQASKEERALLPLARADALLLARAGGATVEKTAADLLQRIAAAAEDTGLSVELELYLGEDPAVIAASGQRRRN